VELPPLLANVSGWGIFLCCWLQVCGGEENKWDYKRVDGLLMEERQGAMFVLPLSAIIETGNHIAEANVRKNSCGLFG